MGNYELEKQGSSQHDLNENILSVYKYTEDYDTGIISAFSSNKSNKLNLLRTRKLLNNLLAYGRYGVIPMYGVYQDTLKSEISFWVFDLENSGKLKEDLRHVATKLNQTHIAYTAKGEQIYFLRPVTGKADQGPAFYSLSGLEKDARSISNISQKLIASNYHQWEMIDPRQLLTSTNIIISKMAQMSRSAYENLYADWGEIANEELHGEFETMIHPLYYQGEINEPNI